MKTTRTECRCHGISGTCSAQTCAEAVQSVEEVGEELVELYDTAQRHEDHVNVGYCRINYH